LAWEREKREIFSNSAFVLSLTHIAVCRHTQAYPLVAFTTSCAHFIFNKASQIDKKKMLLDA
jgi:hypothetical protein